MANTDTKFNAKSPNGIIGNARVGKKLFDEYLSGSNTIDIDFSVNGVLKAQKELDSLAEKMEKVKRLRDENLGARHQDLDAYFKKLQEDYDNESNRIAEITQQLEEKYDISIADEKELLELAEKRRAAEDDIDKKLERIAIKRQRIKANTSMPFLARQSELAELDNEERAQRNLKHKLRGENSEEYDSFLNALGMNPENSFSENDALAGLNTIGNALGVAIPEVAVIRKVMENVSSTVKLIQAGLGELRKDMTKSINQAASAMEGYFGKIQANLSGAGIDYYSIQDDVENAIGFSRLVKQTDYLNQIADLTNQGLVTDIEQRALLQTIKDRTLTSFDVANAGLTRLVRLGEQNSVNQFGVELQLRRLLNSPVFGDASYLTGLFDSVTNAVLDASISTASDLTNFNSTIQSYLGAMYASGLSDNIVSAIASGINALGSGNVSALAGDESIQRLFLLSMDRIGMDYADILQQGLSSTDTANLLTSIIEYLNEIATNTSDNLVLKSSYSSLFNMSVSDMEAIQNVYSKIGSISSSIVNANQASTITANAVTDMVAANTLASEQFENFFANFSYAFGSNVAENNALYTTYRIADISYDLLDGFSKVGGILGKTLNIAKLVPAAVQYAIGGASFINMLTEAQAGIGENNLINLLGSSESTSIFTTADSSTSNFKTFKQTSLTNAIQTAYASASDWEAGAEDEVLGVLKELSKTLMKLENGDGYAFAVSVEGMNNAVLRSFASIFADEDAMMATFTGDNTVLNDALFNYFDDTTSNSTTADKVNA